VTDHDALLAAYDDLRPWVPFDPPPGLTYESRGSVLRVVGQYRGFIDTARDVGVQGEALDSLITEQRDFFAQRGEAVEWKTRGHDEPPDLPARLLAAGFVPEERETVVIGDARQMAVEPVLPDGVQLRQVHEPGDFERIAAMESEVWDDDFSWMAQDLHARVQTSPHEIVVLVAEADGQVVSAAWLVFKPGTEFAGLWGGSTLPDWRGRGIYRALVARRAQLACARGVRYLQVDASDESRPILLKLGFQAVTTTTPYVWTPGTIVTNRGARVPLLPAVWLSAHDRPELVGTGEDDGAHDLTA
jgi:GNAT superfamily N-acetyltransferase